MVVRTPWAPSSASSGRLLARPTSLGRLLPPLLTSTAIPCVPAVPFYPQYGGAVILLDSTQASFDGATLAENTAEYVRVSCLSATLSRCRPLSGRAVYQNRGRGGQDPVGALVCVQLPVARSSDVAWPHACRLRSPALRSPVCLLSPSIPRAAARSFWMAAPR